MLLWFISVVYNFGYRNIFSIHRLELLFILFLLHTYVAYIMVSNI